MEVLAYLLADPLSVLADTGPNPAPHILFGSRKTNQRDEELLQLFSDILLGLEQGKTFSGPPMALITITMAYIDETFGALRRQPRKQPWRQQEAPGIGLLHCAIPTVQERNV